LEADVLIIDEVPKINKETVKTGKAKKSKQHGVSLDVRLLIVECPPFLF